MKNFLLKILRIKYKFIVRPCLFKIDSEKVHEWFIKFGQLIAHNTFLRSMLRFFFGKKYKKLNKKVCGVEFDAPVGLAAGFDYDGKLTDVTSLLGFGFHTIGTVTNEPYEGNPKPRLGRLIKSKALLVNKGFKSSGIDKVLSDLEDKDFKIPIGISIGKSNLLSINTQQLAIEDIVSAFRKTEESKILFSYYELNISCPNLFGDVEFYTKNNLEELLESVDNLNIQKPIFIKMPIEKSDSETLEILNVISDFKSIKGIVIGNLQKNRKHKLIIQEEISKYERGYASGLPTKNRSTELIKLAKSNFKNRFVIIGCGGIFNTEDAKEKLEAGADLLQLITGMIYEGPQVVAQINRDLGSN